MDYFKLDIDLKSKMKQNVVKTIVKIFGERGKVWLESESFIRKFRRGYFSEGAVKSLPHLVSTGDICVDIGANVGEYTFWLSKITGPTGRVVAFEAIPYTHNILKRVIKRFKLSNVEMHQIALGDTNSYVKFVVPKHDLNNMFPVHQVSHLHGEKESANPNLEVKMVRFDDIRKELNLDKINLIKIDIEGAELLFFKGAMSFFTKVSPIIICEIEEKHTIRYGYKPDKVFGLLEYLGYERYIFNMCSNTFTVLDKKDSSKKEEAVHNYIFIHKSDELPYKWPAKFVKLSI